MCGPLLHLLLPLPLLLPLLLAWSTPAPQATQSRAGPARGRRRPALLRLLVWPQAGAGMRLPRLGRAPQARQSSRHLLLLLLVAAQVQAPRCAGVSRQQGAGSLHHTTACRAAAGCWVHLLLLGRRRRRRCGG